MSDFKTAFKDGLQAAEKASKAMEEIDKVLAQVNTDVLAASDGKVTIELRTFTEVVQPNISSKVQEMAGLYPLPQRRQYQAIVAFNPKIQESPLKELARWRVDKNGYPCAIIWGNEHRECSDRVGLENGLAELLKDTEVGQKFRSLMQMQPKASQPSP